MKKVKPLAAVSLKMVQGLLGFEEIIDYKLKMIPGNPYFYWLEAREGYPAFLLANPEHFFADYQIRIDSKLLNGLKLDGAEPDVYTLITVTEDMVKMTANLLAPLFVNRDKRLAMQLVLHDSPYTTRHYLLPSEKRANCG